MGLNLSPITYSWATYLTSMQGCRCSLGTTGKYFISDFVLNCQDMIIIKSLIFPIKTKTQHTMCSLIVPTWSVAFSLLHAQYVNASASLQFLIFKMIFVIQQIYLQSLAWAGHILNALIVICLILATILEGRCFSFYFPLSDEETKAHVHISEKQQNQIFSSGTPENILLYCLKNETDRTGWRDCIQSDQHTVQLIKNTQWTGVTLTTANNIFVDWESEITGGVTDPSRHPPLLRSKGSFKV